MPKFLINNKAFVLLFFAIMFSFVSLSCTQEPEKAKEPELELTLTCQYPEGALLSAHTHKFMDIVEEKSDGAITFETHLGGTIMQPDETVDVIGGGVGDLGTSAWIYAPGKLPLGAYSFNFVFNEPDVRTQAKIAREMFNSIPALEEELAEHNIAPPLIFAPLTEYVFMSDQPIKNLEDLEGKTLGSTPVEFVPVARAADMAYVTMPAVDFYENLDRGVIDVVTTSKELLHQLNLHEIADYVLETNIVTPMVMSLWFNQDTWEALTEEQRELFIEAGKEAEEAYLDLLEDRRQQVEEEFENAGVETYRLTEEEMAEWANQMPDIPAEWASRLEARGLPAWEVVDTYIELSEREGWEFPREWGER